MPYLWYYLELFLEPSDPLARNDLGEPLNLDLQSGSCNVSLSTCDELTECIVDEHILRLLGEREREREREEREREREEREERGERGEREREEREERERRERREEREERERREKREERERREREERDRRVFTFTFPPQNTHCVCTKHQPKGILFFLTIAEFTKGNGLDKQQVMK